MTINKRSATYKEGQQAFKDGLMMADKPSQYILQDWEAGWHDAHAEMTRRIGAKLAVDE